MLELKEGVLKNGNGSLQMQPMSFTVDEGQILHIGGDAPAATLLLRSLLGMHPLAQGHITIDGDALVPRTANYFRQRMAYVSSDLQLSLHSVAELVGNIFHLDVNADVPFRKSALMEHWQQLDIDASFYETSFREVPFNIQQRIQVALAGLLHKPIIFIDNPTRLQDESHIRLTAQYLRSAAFAHSAVVLATNDATLASICHKHAVIQPVPTH